MRRTYQQPDEPLAIDAGVIAEYLDRMRKPDMAAFVRTLGSQAQRDNQRQKRLFERVLELEAKYEPTVRERPFDPTPPADASD